jgi:hypothetical protein
MHKIFSLEILKGRDYAEELGVDGKIILEKILEKQDGNLWTELIWIRTGPVVGFYEHDNEHSGSIKGGKFLY